MLPKFSRPFRAVGYLLVIGTLLWVFGLAFGTAVVALGLFGRMCRNSDDDICLS